MTTGRINQVSVDMDYKSRLSVNQDALSSPFCTYCALSWYLIAKVLSV